MIMWRPAESYFQQQKHEFKHLEYFYFHNCIYETVWKDNRRRDERIPTFEVMNKYNQDYKLIIIGDAAMSPYEVVSQGGSVEHNNDESGLVWLQRLKDHYPFLTWINPNSERNWDYFQSTEILREFTENRMFPMTIGGITKAMKALKDKKLKYLFPQEK